MITVFNGKLNYTDSELNAYELVKPANAGRVWQGVQHGALVHEIESQMDNLGWTFENRKIYVDQKHEEDMVGGWEVTIPGIEPMDDQKLALGFQTSNRMMHNLRLLVGSVVCVCTNGLATGEVVLNKRHTFNLDLHSVIADSLQSYREKARNLINVTDWLKEQELSDEEADHILMETGRNKMIGWSTLGDVSKEYLHPTFADNGTKTLWGFTTPSPM